MFTMLLLILFLTGCGSSAKGNRGSSKSSISTNENEVMTFSTTYSSVTDKVAIDSSNKKTETEELLEETENSSLSFSESETNELSEKEIVTTKSIEQEKNTKSTEKTTQNVTQESISDSTIPDSTEQEATLKDLSQASQIEMVSNEWANLYGNIDDIIMDNEAIKAWNETQMVSEYTGIKNLWEIGDTISGEKVKSEIIGYDFPDKEYLDGTTLTKEKKQAIIDNCNLSALTDEIDVRFGIIISNADVRSFPTSSIIRDDQDAEGFDYFQESMSSVGEAVAIYHTSLDGIWYFVETQTYCGWISRYNIGLCDIEKAKDFVEAKDFVTILGEVKLNDKYLRMGTTFPLESDNKNSYIISFPYKDDEGNLYLQSMDIQKSNNFYRGYLPYTVRNVTNQALKLEGVPYGWGDKNGSLDCSSTMTSIYKCFGLILPRNTTAQMNIQSTNHEVSGYSESEKLTLLDEVRPGTLLVFSGHVMMYLGQKNGVRYILHNVTQYSTDNNNIIDVYKCVVTPLSLYRLNGKSYISEISHIIEIL